jgi:nitrite reductase/ring-hydroxylating ferredoxin subunit
MKTMSTEMESPQPLVGYRTNEEWQDLLAQVATMIEDIESMPDETLRQKVLLTLQAIDTIHREALHRLVRLFKQGVLDQVVTDPAIRTLMGMYDLLPEEKSGCAKVWDFLPEAGASVDKVESASGSRPLLDGLAPTNELPHWLPVPIDQCPSEGKAIISGTPERAVILAQVERGFYGLDAMCPNHERTMAGGRLNGLSWICPHGPGCIFDIRNGARLGGGRGLICYPVRQTGSGVQIGFGIPFEPKLPAF